jgi:AbrB family looped-hinge helix DNA binding protein
MRQDRCDAVIARSAARSCIRAPICSACHLAAIQVAPFPTVTPRSSPRPKGLEAARKRGRWLPGRCRYSGRESRSGDPPARKGQFVIPKAVRDHAQIVPGSSFSVHYVDGEIRLRPLAPRPWTKWQPICLARPGRKAVKAAC